MKSQQYSAIGHIMATLGLNESECDITFTNSSYIIQPNKEGKELHITSIANADIFKRYNLEFKDCIFKCELLLEQQKISTVLSFIGCIFKENVSLKKSEFLECISFKDSTFEKNAAFSYARFRSQADFSGATFKGIPYFTTSSLQNVSLPHNLPELGVFSP